MSEITQKDFNNLVFVRKGKILTDSLSVSRVFHKENRNIMRSIDSLRKEIRGLLRSEQPPQAREIMEKVRFYDGTYTQEQNGQHYRNIFMNREGFLNLVMQFKGTQAIIFKNMYFYAFDYMEQIIQHPKMNKLAQRDQELIQQQNNEYESKYHQQKHLNWYEEQTVKALKPASDAYYQEMASPYVHPLSNLAERYGTDAMTMNLVLQKMGLIGKKGKRWYLTKNFRNYPYASHDLTYVGEHGSGTDSGALKWTQKGFGLIRELLKIYFNITELHQKGAEFNNTFLLTREHGKLRVVKMTAKQLSIEMKHRNGGNQ